MAYITNNDKMLEAVLLNEELMSMGKYTASDIKSLYQSLESENTIINAVAQIIKMSSDDSSDKEIYKTITEYLKKNV